jgi:hypothetical protein
MLIIAEARVISTARVQATPSCLNGEGADTIRLDEVILEHAVRTAAL